MEFIALGVIGRAFGLKGEVKVHPYNPQTTWFDASDGVWIQGKSAGDPVRWKILARRWHKDFIILRLEGVMDRDDAEALRGAEVFAREDELPELEDGEYYWRQLIGLTVETGDGDPVGRVVRMEETASALGGNDFFVIEGPAGELLVPATDEAVDRVDLAAGRIVINRLFLEK